MRILVITQYFFPETFRINDVIIELVRRGNVVTVLTGLPNYPTGNIYDGYEKAYDKIENYHGAVVHRCKLRPRKNGVFNLVLNYISFVRQAKKTLRNIKPDFDVIYFYEPSPISSGIPAIWYGSKHHIKTAMYNLDIWPDCVRDTSTKKHPMSKKNPIYLIAKMISKYVYEKFDLIVNKCDEFEYYLKTVLKISTSMVTIDEHAESIYLSVKEEPIQNNIVDFVFLGNIGKSQNCDQILKAFSMSNNASSALHFVGDGSCLKELIKLAETLNVKDKVFFHGKVSVEETIKYYNLADVCLLTLSNQTASGLTPPTKLSGYMASCRCVVASIAGAAKRIIEDSRCGYVCNPDDVEALSKLMNKVIANKEQLTTMGENGRSYFLKHYTLDKHVNSLEKTFLSLINN